MEWMFRVGGAGGSAGGGGGGVGGVAWGGGGASCAARGFLLGGGGAPGGHPGGAPQLCWHRIPRQTLPDRLLLSTACRCVAYCEPLQVEKHLSGFFDEFDNVLSMATIAEFLFKKCSPSAAGRVRGDA